MKWFLITALVICGCNKKAAEEEEAPANVETKATNNNAKTDCVAILSAAEIAKVCGISSPKLHIVSMYERLTNYPCSRYFEASEGINSNVTFEIKEWDSEADVIKELQLQSSEEYLSGSGGKAEPWPDLGPEAFVYTEGTVGEGFLGLSAKYNFYRGHYFITVYSGYGSLCDPTELAELSTRVAKRVEKLLL